MFSYSEFLFYRTFYCIANNNPKRNIVLLKNQTAAPMPSRLCMSFFFSSANGVLLLWTLWSFHQRNRRWMLQDDHTNFCYIFEINFFIMTWWVSIVKHWKKFDSANLVHASSILCVSAEHICGGIFQGSWHYYRNNLYGASYFLGAVEKLSAPNIDNGYGSIRVVLVNGFLEADSGVNRMWKSLWFPWADDNMDRT